ncbi:unnamed protein product, partial [Symbiodinium microadriaticum]
MDMDLVRSAAQAAADATAAALRGCPPTTRSTRGLFAACVDGPSSGTRGPGLGVGLARFREALDSSSVTVLMRLVQLKIRLRVPSTWVRHLTTTVTITVMTKALLDETEHPTAKSKGWEAYLRLCTSMAFSPL